MTDSQVAAIVSIVQKQRREMSVADMMKHNMIAPIQDVSFEVQLDYCKYSVADD